MTIRVLDSGLVSKAGHHYSFDKRLVAADPTIEVYGFRNMEQNILMEGWAKGLFDHWLYIRTSTNQHTMVLDDFIAISDSVAYNLTALPVQDGDTLLLHTADAKMLYGLGRWLNREKPKVKIRIILGLPGMVDENGKPTVWLPFYMKAVNEIAYWGGDVKYGTHTEWLIGEGNMIGVNPQVVPPAAMNATTPKDEVDEPLFGFLGHANGVKGLQLLCQAMDLDKEGKFLCQVNPPAPIRLPNVDTIQGELTGEQYIKALSDMDAIILPYQRSYYKGHISGVFLESIVSGRPVIIPADTWLEYEAKRFGIGYETFESGNTTSLLMAIQAMRKNWKQHYTSSISKIEQLTQKYSVERYLEWVRS